MNSQTWGYALMALAAGALFPMQTAANSQLARGVGGPIAATLVSFGSGLVLLLLLNALVFRQYPSVPDLLAQPPWLLWIGGTIGAVFLSANVFLAPKLGAAVTLCFVIAGQLLAALTIDGLGLFGLAAREFSLGRLGGVALVLIGAVLVRLT